MKDEGMKQICQQFRLSGISGIMDDELETIRS